MSHQEHRETSARAILVEIRDQAPSLQPSERLVADLFLRDPGTASTLSIAQMAQRCGVSTTSVVRFCKRLGYQHVRDLRNAVLREVERESITTAGLPTVAAEIDRDDSLEDIVAKISLSETLSIADTAKTLDIAQLRTAVSAVDAASQIVSFGVGAGSFISLDLQQKLTRIGRTAIHWSDPHAAWTSAATLRQDSVAVAVSHSGETTDTIDFLDVAQQSGAVTIAITNHRGSRLASTADIVLSTAARETRFRSGALGSRIAQLMIVDCLFIGVVQASFDRSVESLRNTYTVVHEGRRTAGPRVARE
ncbi:MAG: RpiR family transcriptional regulator [Candidatus Lumbricidophila eiseniae]|uniref:RpiR family transcriptional regulator n=1 Tax=Candidatus Lumbricidiphila eiseniae TaxID=1969409 RepID=A0A2A6FUR5_9MICO|nr:MAG: RpiR family transcriptional regulator [Candidatus Lumbricidophila eiseniae]